MKKYDAQGRAYDSFLAKASSPEADLFCRLHGLNKSFRMDVGVVGEETSELFCRLWAHKAQYYLDVYRDSEAQGYVFSASDHSSYEQSDDLRARACGLQVVALHRRGARDRRKR